MTDQENQDGRRGAEDGPGGMVAELLDVAPYFSELTQEELTGLADAVAVVSFGAGDVVLAEGDRGESLFFVSKGVLTVRTSGPDGNQVTVGTLSAGDLFGEVSLLLGRPRTATVSAETEVVCLEVGREEWSRLQGAHPRLRAVLDETLQARAALSAEAVVEDHRRRRSDGKAEA